MSVQLFLYKLFVQKKVQKSKLLSLKSKYQSIFEDVVEKVASISIICLLSFICSGLSYLALASNEGKIKDQKQHNLNGVLINHFAPPGHWYDNNEKYFDLILEENELHYALKSLSVFTSKQIMAMLSVVFIQQFSIACNTLKSNELKIMPVILKPFYKQIWFDIIPGVKNAYDVSKKFFEMQQYYHQLTCFDCSQHLRILLHVNPLYPRNSIMATSLKELKKLDDGNSKTLFLGVLKLVETLTVFTTADQATFSHGRAIRVWPVIFEVSLWLSQQQDVLLNGLLEQVNHRGNTPEREALFKYMRLALPPAEKRKEIATKNLTDELLGNPHNQQLIQYLKTVQCLYNYYTQKIAPPTFVTKEKQKQQTIWRDYVSNAVVDPAKNIVKNFMGKKKEMSPVQVMSNWLQQIRTNREMLSWYKDPSPESLVVEILNDIAKKQTGENFPINEALVALVEQRFDSLRIHSALMLLLGRTLPRDQDHQNYIPVSINKESQRLTRSATKKRSGSTQACNEDSNAATSQKQIRLDVTLPFCINNKSVRSSKKKKSDNNQSKDNKKNRIAVKRPAEDMLSQEQLDSMKRMTRATAMELACSQRSNRRPTPASAYNNTHQFSGYHNGSSQHIKSVWLMVPESEYLKTLSVDSDAYPRAEHTQAHEDWLLVLVGVESQSDAEEGNGNINRNITINPFSSWSLRTKLTLGSVFLMTLIGGVVALSDTGQQAFTKCLNGTNHLVCVSEDFSLQRSRCPIGNERRIISEDAVVHLCDDHTKVSSYTCLEYYNSYLDTNNPYLAGCVGVDYSSVGSFLVLEPNLNKRNCAENRFQPFPYSTLFGSRCIYSKLLCSEMGQMVKNNNDGVNDRQCGCDTEQGYSYINETMKQNESCTPSKLDCSCFKNPEITATSIHQIDKKLGRSVDSGSQFDAEHLSYHRPGRIVATGFVGGGIALAISGGCLLFFDYDNSASDNLIRFFRHIETEVDQGATAGISSDN